MDFSKSLLSLVVAVLKAEPRTFPHADDIRTADGIISIVIDKLSDAVRTLSVYHSEQPELLNVNFRFNYETDKLTTNTVQMGKFTERTLYTLLANYLIGRGATSIAWEPWYADPVPLPDSFDGLIDLLQLTVSLDPTDTPREVYSIGNNTVTDKGVFDTNLDYVDRGVHGLVRVISSLKGKPHTGWGFIVHTGSREIQWFSSNGADEYRPGVNQVLHMLVDVLWTRCQYIFSKYLPTLWVLQTEKLFELKRLSFLVKAVRTKDGYTREIRYFRKGSMKIAPVFSHVCDHRSMTMHLDNGVEYPLRIAIDGLSAIREIMEWMSSLTLDSKYCIEERSTLTQQLSMLEGMFGNVNATFTVDIGDYDAQLMSVHCQKSGAFRIAVDEGLYRYADLWLLDGNLYVHSLNKDGAAAIAKLCRDLGK